MVGQAHVFDQLRPTPVVSREGVLLQGSGVQQSGVVILGMEPEILSLPFSKNWASHSAPKACAKKQNKFIMQRIWNALYQ